MARSIQCAFLPKEFPPSVAGDKLTRVAEWVGSRLNGLGYEWRRDA
jgi:hypothetical protein